MTDLGLIFHSLDHVSLEALANRRIKLGYTPDVLTEAGSLYPLALLRESMSLRFAPV